MVQQRESVFSPFDQLITEIEAIRTRRMRVHRRQHPAGKRFTQQELNDQACPTYKNYLDGRSRRLPTRETLLDIAAYLECSPEERNHLLRTARYLPEPVDPAPDNLEPILIRGRKLMRDLQFPSLLITRDYRLHTLCPNLRLLLHMPDLQDIPYDQRTLFHLLFEPALTPRLSPETRATWQRTLVSHLKYASTTYTHTGWYCQLLLRLNEYKDFRTLWRDLTPGAVTPAPVMGSVVVEGQPVHFNALYAPVDAQRRAYTLSLLPLDAFARDVFDSVGCQQMPDGDAACLTWEAAYAALIRP